MSSTTSTPAELQATGDGQAPPRTARPGRARVTVRRLITWLAVAALLIAAIVYGVRWWQTGRFLQSTSDAYVRADLVTVAPRVSGYVTDVFVAENQSVEAGQKLVQIDAQNYQAALDQQRASLDARQADVNVAEAKVQQQQASVEQARAALAGAEVAVRYAAQERERYRRLVASGAESAARLAEMVNNLDQSHATELSDQAALHAAEREATTLQAQIGQALAQVNAARAGARQTTFDLGNTLIRASIAGRVGDRTVQIGQFVQPGTRLLSIVPVQDIYIVANFKETQTAHLRVGQPARISVDALGCDVHAVLDSFAPGTGAQFALLPPENATGNFTKIVQRIPVRFRVQADGETQARLLPGLSVTVEVDTRDVQAGSQQLASSDFCTGRAR